MGLTFAIGLVVFLPSNQSVHPWWIPIRSSMKLFGLGGLQPQIRGWLGCDVPFIVFLCYVL
jgi:hypothetical protein